MSKDLGEPEPVAKNESGKITWLVDNWPQNCLLYAAPPQSFTYSQVKAHIQAAILSSGDVVVGEDITEDGVSVVVRKGAKLLHAKFYPYPPQREWVGLTDEEVLEIWLAARNFKEYHRAIEAKLKERNT